MLDRCRTSGRGCFSPIGWWRGLLCSRTRKAPLDGLHAAAPFGGANATSLPPLIAQVEFFIDDVMSAVAFVVGLAQAVFAFAPATFGLIRSFAPKHVDSPAGVAPSIVVTAALFRGLATAAFLTERRR